MKTEITILRLGHRPSRDKRITTHCGLAARAFGASEMIISGDEDDELVERLSGLSKKWGGKFKARYEKDWKKALRAFPGKKVHLTMYGEDFRKTAQDLRDSQAKKVMLVVGAGKVPPEIYGMCDVNSAVGNQPHSEVAALGLFLYELSGRNPAAFSDAKIQITPSAGKKTVVDRSRKAAKTKGKHANAKTKNARPARKKGRRPRPKTAGKK
ncbi:MAG: tRNA (cytidine(56)-2'-O)-methyltransferase [Candidatus Micrarchaeia archaeon]|jgi:tRNA (cytidine56-2'-O)-methyltransferase